MTAVDSKNDAGEWVTTVLPWHLECELRPALSHWVRQCPCYVPGRSLREEARARGLPRCDRPDARAARCEIWVKLARSPELPRSTAGVQAVAEDAFDLRKHN